MECQGLYLYGFARAGATEGVELEGLLSNEPVAALESRGVAAVYSRVPAAEFEAALASAEAPDPEWLIPRACRHEQVLEAVMERSAVLPVRFGAIFSSPEALTSFTEAHSETIARFLDETNGKQEWAVRFLVDLDRLADVLVEREPDLAAQHAALPQSLGARYFREKRLRNEARTHAVRLSRALAFEFQRQLEGAGWAVRVLPLRSSAGSSASLVLHLAVLLPGDAVKCLESQADALLAWNHAAAVWIEQTGPWPPSHFCPVLETATCEFEPTP